MRGKIRTALIYGSTREGRFCDRVAGWVASEIAVRNAFSVDFVDPDTLELPSRHERQLAPAVARLRERIGKADAYIVVTPEYNHGYPAALKFVIDSVRDEWRAKPVGFVSYGGLSGGLRAVEQLRLVFAELHAVTLRDVLSFANYWEQFDSDGALRRPEPAREAMGRLLGQLHWWAAALRKARRDLPYGDAVA